MNVKSIAFACCPPALKPMLDRVENSSAGSRLARGTFWSMTGSVISRGLTLAAAVLVARMLGKDIYGEFGIVKSTIGMFGVFAGYGLGMTATKYVAEFRQSNSERAGRIIGLSGLVATISGGVMALGLCLFAPWLAEHTLNAPHLTGVLRVSALVLFFSAINSVQIGVLSGFEAFKATAYVNLYVGLISFPLLVCGAYFAGLSGAVWALAINLGVNWLLNHLVLRKETLKHGISFSFRNCSRELSVLWRFSLPAVLGGVLIGPVTWVCNAMLVNQPGGYGQMGIFTAALVFQNLLIFASGMLNAPLLAMVSNAGANVSEKLGIVNILSSWILGVLTAIPLLCFPEIAQSLFGADFEMRSFTVAFSIIVFYTSIMIFKAGLARIIVANNLLWWSFYCNVLWAIALMGFANYFVEWGATGLAMSFAIAYTLNTIVLVPVCFYKKLVPKGTLLSLESVMIWSIILVLVFLNLVDAPLYFRAIAFLPCLMLAGIAFIRIAKPVISTKEQATNG